MNIDDRNVTVKWDTIQVHSADFQSKDLVTTHKIRLRFMIYEFHELMYECALISDDNFISDDILCDQGWSKHGTDISLIKIKLSIFIELITK